MHMYTVLKHAPLEGFGGGLSDEDDVKGLCIAVGYVL